MKKLMVAVSLLSSLLPLLSCATAQPPQAIPLPAARIVCRGYSFQPLQEKGWIVGCCSERKVLLWREGANPDETFAIQAGIERIEGIVTQQDLVDCVTNRERVDPGDVRFRNARVEVAPATFGGARCAVSLVEMEDHGALTASARRDPMIIQARTVRCKHPVLRDMVVFVSYSHRHYREDGDPAFAQKSQAILDGLAFSAE